MNIKKFLHNMYLNTENYKRKVIRETIKKYGPFENFLDVGCWDGEATLDAISQTKIKNIYGIEPVIEYAEKASKKGISTKTFYVDKQAWDLKNNYFDCINSCEVIEHLSNVDLFLDEASKKLKSGGYLVTTTNNLASFHNIFSIFLGWAPFDLSNSSIKVWSLGNPLSVHNDEALSDRGETWTHKCVYTPYWLTKWSELYGFEFVEYRGIGFYPFPPSFGSLFKKHAAFFTLVLRKK
jgi:SAM-dependent methyltransferase